MINDLARATWRWTEKMFCFGFLSYMATVRNQHRGAGHGDDTDMNDVQEGSESEKEEENVLVNQEQISARPLRPSGLS